MLFKNNIIKRILTSCMVVTMFVQFSFCVYAVTVNVGSTVASLPIEKLNENFEDGNVDADIDNYNSWENVWGNTNSSITLKNSEMTLATEVDYATQTSIDNKVLALKRTGASSSSCVDNYAKKTLNIKPGTDKIGISFRLKNMDSDNRMMRLLLKSGTATPELHIDLQNGSISSGQISMPATTFSGNTAMVPLGIWQTVEIVIYTETKHIEFYVNGVLRSRTYAEMSTSNIGDLFEGQLDWIGIGTLRATGVRDGGDSALIYIDDFTVRTEGQYDAVMGDIAAINDIVSTVSVNFNITPPAGTKAILATYEYENGYKRFIEARMVEFSCSGTIDLLTPIKVPENGELRGFIFNMTNLLSLGKVKSYSSLTTKYVSPNGNDSNSGSIDAPWKTLSKAASEATAGDTILLEDGVYNEEFTTIIRESGTAEAPITIRAKNKGKATVVYDEKLNTGWKFLISDDVDYIRVEDLIFTQETANPDVNETQDIMLFCKGDNCLIKGNRFSNVMEEAIKLDKSKDTIIEDNYISDITHEGMDIFDSDGIIVRNNEIYNVGRIGILCKGNARNCMVYNNYIHSSNVTMSSAAICVGGMSDGTSPSDTKANTGYECYSSVFWNNVILSESANKISRGIWVLGAIDCHIYNNNIVGASNGVQLSKATNTANGWGWDPPITGLKVKNNIICDCKSSFVTDSNAAVSELERTHNLYYNCEDMTSYNEEGIVKSDPKFVSDDDMHLQSGSPAIGSGCTLPTSYYKYEWNSTSEKIEKTNNIFAIEFANKEGTSNNPPNIGAY